VSTTSPRTESLGHNQAKDCSMAGRVVPSAGRAGAGRARPDRAGVRRAQPGRCQPGSGMARSGRHRTGPGVAKVAAAVHVEVMWERERSRRKKGWAWVLYPPMFIGPTHQLMNISGLAYVAAMAPYVRRQPDEHKLHTSVFKPMNVIWNMNIGPNEHKKTIEWIPFSGSVSKNLVVMMLNSCKG
jgi:hypothetical protein